MALSCPGCLQQPLLAAPVSTHQASLVAGSDLLTANFLSLIPFADRKCGLRFVSICEIRG